MSEIPAGENFGVTIDQRASLASSNIARVRLILALAATASLLPYAWARSFLIFLMTGRTEPYYLGMLLTGLAVVMALTFRLGLSFRPPARRNIGLLVAAMWIAIVGGVVIFNSGDMISPYVVAVAFLPATAWVVWTAWMFFAPLSIWVRAGVLAVSLVGVPVFVHLFRVDGLTGDAKVNFGYRRGSPADAVSNWNDSAPGGSTARLESNGRDDFAQFNGPERTAVLKDVRLARDWAVRPPKQLWRKRVGEGWSGFAVVGDAAITQEQRGERECVVCRNLQTGDELWSHADDAHFDNTLGGPGPRATPTIAEGRVYTVGATGILNCLEGKTGKKAWGVNILEDSNTKNSFHGVCGSPLVFDNFVIVCPTEKESAALAAYDKRDGHRLWANGKHPASYSSPLLANIAGVRQILYYNELGVAGHNPTTGEVLWSYDWTNDQKVVCSQPIVLPGPQDRVLLTTGYAKGSTIVGLRCSPSGQWDEPEQIWKSTNMKTKFTTAVVHGDHVYGLDDGILQCVDLKTGKAAWKRGRYGHGQLLLAGDLLLIQTEPGEVALVEANPQKLNELGRLPALQSKTWNCPALAGNHLVVRNDQEAICFELPVEKEPPSNK